jgi:tetrapyrrole methylase family protein/MazG family protein
VKPKLTVCGLGPGGQGHLTTETERVLSEAAVCYLRTERHPSASKVPEARSFDHVYEAASSFSEVYARIVEDLVEAASATEGVVYAVPGSPLVLEESVRRLRRDERVEVELVPALSFLDLVWARLGVDPVDDGVRLVDGHRFGSEAAGERGPLLVAHTHARYVLSDIKLAIDAGPEQTATVLQRLGTPDEAIFEVSWPDLDRVVEPDHLTSLYLPEVTAPVARELARTVELMHRLRQECPWDRDQDHLSLRPYLLEETYELLDAIDALASDEPPRADELPGGDEVPGEEPAVGPDAGEAGPYQQLEEELGDVWFQVLFHAELATEAGEFTMAHVARTLHDKLVSRHPHVFGDVQVDSTDELISNWERIKRTEKQRRSALDGIPGSLPALSLAAKTLQRARRAGAEVASGAAVPGVAELMGGADSEAGLGRLLLAVVEVASARGLDPEHALRAAVRAAAGRFRREEAAGRVTSDWVRG